MNFILFLQYVVLVTSHIIMEQRSLFMFEGQIFTVPFTSPNGLIIMREWDEASISIQAHNPSTGQQVVYSPISQGSSKIGVYFGKYIGSAIISAIDDSLVEYSMVEFPSDCDIKYTTNTIHSDIVASLSNGLLRNSSTFCLFNAAGPSIEYKINFALKHKTNRIYFYSETQEIVNLTGIGAYNKTISYPALIKIVTDEEITESEYVSIYMTSHRGSSPQYNFTGIVDGTVPRFVIGVATKKKYLSSTMIVGILIAFCLFIGVLLYIINYSCIKYKAYKISRNPPNRVEEEENENFSNQRDDRISSRSQFPQDIEHVSEKYSDGRFKTPAHLNIELMSTSLDPANFISENSMKSKSVDFGSEVIKDDIMDDNGYPDSFYQPPSVGFLPPTSLSFLDDQEVDEANENISQNSMDSLSDNDVVREIDI
ncbi:hypothetical protein TRFO_08578 [Tritrichomonas foetus]|uniref:Uncharacterized protein n=1 Tax=Tritrichomonas foetus TaxID=1144522 RepID=A0A1J4JIR7_9EUKA|nr:hypothetical protein TRFO_08578 [Tritrichomonas foetus]|eukprot:OHS99026.1 hypothetical protein TRFO_08578 [Tritrichomonas foetus]